MEIKLSKHIILTSSSKCFILKIFDNKGKLETRAFFNNLEQCYEEFISYKVRKSQATEFSELIDEIKKVYKTIEISTGVIKDVK